MSSRHPRPQYHPASMDTTRTGGSVQQPAQRGPAWRTTKPTHHTIRSNLEFLTQSRIPTEATYDEGYGPYATQIVAHHRKVLFFKQSTDTVAAQRLLVIDRSQSS